MALDYDRTGSKRPEEWPDERAACADRPDIDAPVDADEDGRQACHGQHLRGSERGSDFRRASERNQHDGRNRHRPDDAMDDDLNRRNMRNRLHVKGKKPPEQISGKRESKTARAVAALLGRERFVECHGEYRQLFG